MPKFKGKKPVSKAVKNYVQKAIDADVETKTTTLVNTLAAASTGWAGTTLDMFPLAQGINTNQRIGGVVEPVRVKVRMNITSVTALVFRVLAVRIKQQTTNVLQAINTILAGTGAATAAVSLYNTDSTVNKEFDVLSDRSFNINVGAGLTKVIDLNFSKKKLNRLIHFNGAAATDIGKGNIQLILISDAANGPLVDYSYQCWYKDA